MAISNNRFKPEVPLTVLRAEKVGLTEHNTRSVGLFLLEAGPKQINRFLNKPDDWAKARYWYYDSYGRYAIATSLADYIDASPAVQKRLKQLGIHYRGLLEPARTRQSHQSKDDSPTASAPGTLQRNKRLPEKENAKKADAKGKSFVQKIGKERVKIKDASREVSAATKFIEQKTGEDGAQTEGASREESAEAESTTQDTGDVSRMQEDKSAQDDSGESGLQNECQQQSAHSIKDTEEEQVTLPPSVVLLVENAPSLNTPLSVEQMEITLPDHHQGRHLQKPLRLLNKGGTIAVLDTSGWSEQDMARDIKQLIDARRDAPQTFSLQSTSDDQSYVGALRRAKDDTNAVLRWLRHVFGGIGILRPPPNSAPARYELCILGLTKSEADQSQTLQSDLKQAFAKLGEFAKRRELEELRKLGETLGSCDITVNIITAPMQAPSGGTSNDSSKPVESHASGLIAMRMVKYFHERWDAQLDKGSHPSLKEVFRKISKVQQERDFAEHSKD